VGTGSPSGNAAQRRSGTRFLAWVRQAFAETETGRLHAPGLAAFGLDPARLILVRARDTIGVLRAGVEAARCGGLGAVIIEPWGNHRALDLTATRRLALAAEKSGVAVILLRQGGEAEVSAASTRWRVGALASGPLAANAPGRPAFDVTLLRHRAGPAGSTWRLEWDHEQHVFRRLAPLSGAVVSLPSDRPAAAQILPLARAFPVSRPSRPTTKPMPPLSSASPISATATRRWSPSTRRTASSSTSPAAPISSAARRG
jgi:protein ImuA